MEKQEQKCGVLAKENAGAVLGCSRLTRAWLGCYS